MQPSCYLMGSLGSLGTCQGLRRIQGSPGFVGYLPLDLSVVSPVSMGSPGFSRQHLQASTTSAAHECSVGRHDQHTFSVPAAAAGDLFSLLSSSSLVLDSVDRVREFGEHRCFSLSYSACKYRSKINASCSRVLLTQLSEAASFSELTAYLELIKFLLQSLKLRMFGVSLCNQSLNMNSRTPQERWQDQCGLYHLTCFQ